MAASMGDDVDILKKKKAVKEPPSSPAITKDGPPAAAARGRGRSPSKTSYWLTRIVFLRGLGFIYGKGVGAVGHQLQQSRA